MTPGLLTQSRHLGEMFENTASICQMPKKAANWYIGETPPSGERRRHGNRRYFLLSGTSRRTDPDDRQGRTEQQNSQRSFPDDLYEDVDPVVYAEEKRPEDVLDTGLLEEPWQKSWRKIRIQ